MNFEYIQAKTLTDALEFLEKFAGDAKIFAGGTEMLVNLKHQALNPKYLIDIKSIPGLSYIRYDDQGTLSIGALTKLRDIECSSEIKERHALLAEAAQSIATLQIRNVGTVGGNLSQTVKCPFYNQSHVNLFMRQSITPCRQRGGKVCHAAQTDTLNHAMVGRPSNGCWAPTASDLASPLIALGALIKVVGLEGERQIPAEGLFVGGGKTALQEREILTEVRILPLEKGVKFKYQKYAQDIRNFSILNTAIVLWLDSARVLRDLRIVLGGIGVTPLRLYSLENRLRNQNRSSLPLNVALQEKWAGPWFRGDLTKYKLEKANTMILDVLGDILQ